MSQLDDVYYLYKITNAINSKSYIGVTKNPDKRKRQHLFENRKKANPKLKLAISKYGVNNFKFEIICIGSMQYIYDLERKAVDYFNTIESGYNLAPGGKGGQGQKINSRIDDYHCYVSGFWFPNKRVACDKLHITNTNVFYNRKRNGVLGNTEVKVRGSVSGYPVYFKGFWFPDLDKASHVFSKSKLSIRQCITRGYIEECASKKICTSKKNAEY